MTDYLRELLSVFWLRPETALWRACDIQAMSGFEIKSPSLDLGCGDGLFSFIRAGGRFAEDFDAFRSVGDLNKFFAKADIFDHYDGPAKNIVRVAPRYQFDIGFDHKESLLKKAADIGLYRDLKLGDANSKLPFEDRSFQSIFSNIVYWLDDPDSAFREIARVLKVGGQACVMLPNDTLPAYSFYQRYYKASGDERYAFLDLLDRGRLSDNIKQSKSDAEWRKLFKASGLSVVRHLQHLSSATVQIWDVGFRPMFPVLKKMADKMPPADLIWIKREWVETLSMFANPLALIDIDNAGASSAFHCYTLIK